MPCGIYTWNQFVAFSNTVNALFAIPKAVGSFGLCVLLVLYEVVGGLRAVAWTDLLQGCVLVTGAMAFPDVLIWPRGERGAGGLVTQTLEGLILAVSNPVLSVKELCCSIF